jgi:hypothetical protein
MPQPNVMQHAMCKGPLVAADCKGDEAHVVQWSCKAPHNAAGQQASFEVAPVAVGAAVAGPFAMVKVLGSDVCVD